MSDDALVWLLIFGVLFCFFLLIFILWQTWKISNPDKVACPYTGQPMRSAKDLSYQMKGKVYRYLEGFHEYDNQPFEFEKALFCRDTKRIFPDCKKWLGFECDWSFLKKRFPGNYVSWGSLSEDLKREIKEAHYSLEGFQTEMSSPLYSPSALDPAFFSKPGPLYVDIQSKVLLGWKIVPETELEVLIVQKPLKLITP